MSYAYNPFTDNLDLKGTSGGGGTITAVNGQASLVAPTITVTTTGTTATVEDRAWQTQYVVDSSTTPGLRGTFSTIQAAINEAVIDGADTSTPREIYIRPGVYTENLTIASGIYFLAESIPADNSFFVPTVTITGTHTMAAICSFYSNGICWTSASGNTFSGSATAHIFEAINSQFVNPSGNIITSAGASYVDLFNCFFTGSSDGNSQFNLATAQFHARSCRFNGTSLTFTAGIPVFLDCTDIGNVYLGSQPLRATNCNFVGFNAEPVIQSSGPACLFVNCAFTCASAQTQAVDYGTATRPKFVNCYVYPENTPVSDFTTQVALNTTNGPVWETIGNVLRGVRVNTDYSCNDADAYVGVTSTAAPRSIDLPVNGFIGQQVYVMDESGGAGANNITVTGPSLINGSASYVINTNFQGVLFRCFDGSNWVTLMVSGNPPSPPGISSWVDVSGTSQSMAVNTGYLTENAGLTTFTLPSTAAQFDIIEVVGRGAGGWTIVFNANQQIIFGDMSTTATTGSLSSTNRNDNVKLMCTVAGASTIWTVVRALGNLTLV